jgi:uncharacterized integral membrane protein
MIRLINDTCDVSILISNYLCFLIDRNVTSDTIDIHENLLHLFLRYISENAIETLFIFAPKVLDQFYHAFHPKNGRTVMNGFIRYLTYISQVLKEKICFTVILFHHIIRFVISLLLVPVCHPSLNSHHLSFNCR